MELTYKTLNIFHKYLWNEVDIERFKIHLQTALSGEVDDGYANQKWEQFQKCPIQFAATFNTAFFNAALAHMHEIDYKG